MGTSQQYELFNDYDGFVDKFKRRKTTDDCYTPEPLYTAVRDWCVNKFGLQDTTIVRPFFPGGDYKNFDYPDDCVVIDNPPFSMFSEIVRFYDARDIRYLLFGPHLTIAGMHGFNDTVILCKYNATYENGANLPTSFVTNMMPGVLFHYDADLYAAIKIADNEFKSMKKKKKDVLVLPDNIVSSARLGKYCGGSQSWSIRHAQARRVKKVAMEKDGIVIVKSIFGGGYIITDDATNMLRLERERLERERLERERLE
ncbi:MAG: hypothetical protein MJZ90_10375, partial [Bacteroidales bacterium]|nr:hypothetical protein [Bacteroidales bacterium]